MNATLQEKVIKELGYGMGMDHEKDIAFMALWVSRNLSDSRLKSTMCQMTADGEPMTDELRIKIAEVLRQLADSVEPHDTSNTAYFGGEDA
jgi:hypothetical protein